jgi:hypothetical protein
MRFGASAAVPQLSRSPNTAQVSGGVLAVGEPVKNTTLPGRSAAGGSEAGVRVDQPAGSRNPLRGGRHDYALSFPRGTFRATGNVLSGRYDAGTIITVTISANTGKSSKSG